jgi:hypothetical protein
MRDHRIIEELLSVRALGALDPGDEERLHAEMAEHGACEGCRRIERETQEVAGRLPFALDPIPVGRELEDDTVVLALAARPAAGAGRTPANAPDARRTRASMIRPLVAVAAALVLFVAGWAAGSITHGNRTSATQGTQVATFHGTAQGTLVLVYASPERGGYLVGSNLAPPSSGKTYALWLFHGSSPVNAGCFEPSAAGTILRSVDASLAGAGSAAVTVEPTTCPSAPTSQPILTATL